jgi:hypothetical protein
MILFQAVVLNGVNYDVEFEVVYNVYGKDKPATLHQPAEYAELEIEKLRIIEVTDEDGNVVDINPVLIADVIDIDSIESDIWYYLENCDEV